MRAIAAAAVNTVTRPWWNALAIRCGKNCRPVSTATVPGGSDAQHPGRREQGADRVVTEQGGEQRADRGQVGDLRGDRGRHAVGRQAGEWRAGRLAASPTIISEKKIPIDSDMPEFWKVDRMPEATPRVPAGHAAHDGGGVRRGEQPRCRCRCRR